MEKKLHEQIGELVQKFGEEKTFSLDALKAISDLREGAESLQKMNANQAEDLMRINKILNEERSRLNKAQSELTSFREREEKISGLETEKKLMEQKNQMVDARLGDMKELVSLAFRNPVLKFRKTGSVPVGENGCTAYIDNESTQETE